MAHWASNDTQNAYQRRKWNLEGATRRLVPFCVCVVISIFNLFPFLWADRTSLRNLHGNTSVEGNSNSQYEIAKQILEDDSSK